MTETSQAKPGTGQQQRSRNGHHPEPPPPAVEENGSDAFPCTDLGNAERLVALHGRNLRHCAEWGQWLTWDGKRWLVGNEAVVHQWAKDTARLMREMAQAAQKACQDALKALDAEADGVSVREMGEQTTAENAARRERLIMEQRIIKATLAWEQKSESNARLNDMVALARYEKRIPVSPAELDGNEMLLNCENGTVDLCTGELRPHERADLITKICPVRYDPAAVSDTWQQFLDRTQPDPEMQAFLQRAMGYSLTGSTAEEVLFFAFGPTLSGKSTFLKAFSRMLGDYAKTADFEMFLSGGNRAAGAAKEDVARLAGARFVTSIEVSKGAKLAEGIVKVVTGGDSITARFLYKATFEFSPTYKLWLAANDEPRASDDDAALWRRILQVPFAESIPESERDPGIKAALVEPEISGPALLAWAVQGCLDWQRDGLQVPAAVRKATANYRAGQNPLTDFLAECCVIGVECRCKNDEIWQEYQRWTRENGVRRPVGRKTFTQKMIAYGFTQEHDHNSRFWLGIGILGPENDY